MEGAIFHLIIGIERPTTRFERLSAFSGTHPPPLCFISSHGPFYRRGFRCVPFSARSALPRALLGLRFATTTLLEPIPTGLDSNNAEERIIRLAAARRNNARAASE